MNAKPLKSFLATLLSIALLLSFVPLQGTQYEAAAATGSTSALHYNKGHRDTVATELSTAARAYYADFAFDYSKIAKGETTVSGEDLRKALAGYMQSTLENLITYSKLPTYWAYTDAQDGQAGVVYFYTDNVSTTTSDLNREHVWPKSAASYYEKNGGTDLHHLRPAHANVNSARGNYEMAELDETQAGTQVVYYNGKVAGYIKNSKFEPLENVKGDVARIFLYVYLCWGQPNLFEDVPSALLPAFDSDDSKNDGTKRIESLETLLQWCYDDPVDTWEMEQNDLVEIVQGNRNVFIDYPEYAWLIFGLEVPSGIASPYSGNATPGSYNPGNLSGISGITGAQTVDETKAISLAEANKTESGTVITVVGQVTACFGLNDTMTSAIITDEKGDTLQLYYNTADFKYSVGDIIAVNGSISNYHGVNQINTGFASKLLTKAADAKAPAAAVEVTLAQLKASPDTYLNKNILVKNVVLGKPDPANHTTAISQTINGVTTSLNLYYPASYPSGVAMTDTVNIYAVASKRDSEAQLRVGKSSDYVFVSAGEGYHADLSTEAGILEAAFCLETGKSLGQSVTLSGEITGIKTAFNSQYNNVSVNIKVADKTILCYRMAGGSDLQVGDLITVTGDITNYNGTIEFVAGSTYVKTGGSTATPTVAPTAKPTSIPVAGTYNLITSLNELGEGGKVIIAGNATCVLSSSLNSGKAKAGTLDTAKPEAAVVWTIKKQTDGSYTLYNESVGQYLYIDGTKTNCIKLGSSSAYSFKVTESGNGFLFQSTDAGGRYLSFYEAGSDFRSYALSSALPLVVYKLAEEAAVTPTPLVTATPTAAATPIPSATQMPIVTPEPSGTVTPTVTQLPSVTSAPLPDFSGHQPVHHRSSRLANTYLQLNLHLYQQRRLYNYIQQRTSRSS